SAVGIGTTVVRRTVVSTTVRCWAAPAVVTTRDTVAGSTTALGNIDRMIHVHTERRGDAVHLCNRLHLGGHTRQIHRVRIVYSEFLAALVDRTVVILELTNMGDVPLGRITDMIVLPHDLAVHKRIELHIVLTAVLIQVLVKDKIDARGFA